MITEHFTDLSFDDYNFLMSFTGILCGFSMFLIILFVIINLKA